MKENIKVAIIIPSYNVEQYIEKGITSCMQQTHHNIEIIVVDDGSKDGTAEIVDGISKADSRIKLLRKVNGGVSSARNIGMKSVTADYVIFLDSDDWLETDAVEKLLKLQSEYPDAFIITDRFLVSRNSKGQEKRRFPGQGKKMARVFAEDALANVGTGKYNLQSACYKLFKMTIIGDNDLVFDETLHYGEDGLFVFEYLRHIEKIVYSPVALWNILEREGSATTAGYNSKMLTTHMSIDRMLELLGDSDQVRGALQKYKLRRIESVMRSAMRAGIEENADDLKYLRNVLKEMASSDLNGLGLKDKANYSVYTHCPYLIIKVFGEIKSIIKENMKSIYYSIFKRA